MKQKLLLLLVAWLPIAAFCDKLTVHVETEGTLEEVITNQDVLKITDLTITGRITATDIKYLRNLSGRIINLESLDLKDVTLVASEESYNSTSRSGITTYYYLSEKEGITERRYDDGFTDRYYYYYYVRGMNLAGAFSGMPIKKVVLPSNLKKLGQRCFDGCSKLESVILPDGLAAIEDGAFSNCNVLEFLDIPTSVTSIGESAFSGCSSLRSIIGDFTKIESIGKYAFYGCKAIQGKIELGVAMTEIPEECFARCTGITEVVFPAGLTTIGKSAFSGCTSLSSLSFPNSLSAIGESAFEGCTSLSSLTFPTDGSLETIEDETFYKCSALETLSVPEGVLTIGKLAFYDCGKLTEVSLPSTLQNLEFSSFRGTPWLDAITTDDNGMMVVGNVAVACYLDSDFEQNAKLVFREGIKGIADGFAVYWRNANNTNEITKANVTDVSFPSTLEYIGNKSFNYFTGLTRLVLPASLKKIGDNAFPSTIESVNLPEGLEEIGAYAFSGCSKIEEINFPSTLKKIGCEAFAFCTGVSQITIPESVEVLEAIYTNNTMNNTIYNAGPFYGCSGIIIVRINAKNLADRSEMGELAGLEKIIIGSNVEVLPGELFSNTPMKVEFEERSKDSRLHLEKYCLGRSLSKLSSLSLPDCKISLGNGVFSGFKGTIEIPGEIISIGGSALSGCTGLTSVRLSDEMTEIPSSAFSGCTGLTSINIPNSVTSIGDYAFNNCSGLTSINIPNSVTSIGGNAFNGCSGLTAVHISDIAAWCGISFYSSPSVSVSNPLQYAKHLYLNGEELKDLVIPDGVTSIGERAFDCCSGLTSVTIGDGVTSIGKYAFNNCSGLTSVTIGDGVTSIGEYAFYNCDNITSVISFTEEPFNLGYSGFSCYDNATLYVPAGTRQVYRNSWWGGRFKYIREGDGTWPEDAITFVDTDVEKTCIGYWDTNGDGYLSYDEAAAVEELKRQDGRTLFLSTITSFEEIKYFKCLKVIGDKAFSGCSSLTSIDIPNSVTSIGKNAFSGCSGLTSVTIPASVTSIGESAFDGCTGLTAVHISDITAWCGISFSSGSSPLVNGHHLYLNGEEIKDLVIPDDVTSIGDYAFSGCSGLTSVTIGDGVTSIGYYAFDGCSGLTSIDIPNSVTSIGYYAFYGCSGLTSVTIGSSVTSIGRAFGGCSGLTSVTSYIKEPFEIDYFTFDDSYDRATLYVPAGTSGKYKSIYSWKNFSNIEEIVSTITGDADGDGEVTLEDVELVKEYIFTGKAEGLNFTNADTNGNKQLNAADIVKILNIIKNKKSEKALYDDEDAPCVEDPDEDPEEL